MRWQTISVTTVIGVGSRERGETDRAYGGGIYNLGDVLADALLMPTHFPQVNNQPIANEILITTIGHILVIRVIFYEIPF